MKSFTRLVFLSLALVLCCQCGTPEWVIKLLKVTPLLSGNVQPSKEAQFYTTNARYCFCGPNVEMLDSLGELVPMWRLTASEFIYKNIKQTNSMNQPKYTNSYMSGRFSSEMMWYGPSDMSFYSYGAQKSKMKSTLDGWAKIMEVTGSVIDPTECDIYIGYVDPSLSSFFVSNWGFNPKPDAMVKVDEYIALIKERGIEEMMFNKDVRPYYFPREVPTDDEIISFDKNLKNKKIGKNERNIASAQLRANAVICPIKGTVKKMRGPNPGDSDEEVALDFSLAFVEGYNSAGFGKFFVLLNGAPKFEGWKGANELVKLTEAAEPKGKKLQRVEKMDFSKEVLVTMNAFFWQESLDIMNLSEDEDKTLTVEHMNLPNGFEQTLCDELIKGTSLGKYFHLENLLNGKVQSLSFNGLKIWQSYIDKCPMIAWRGKIPYKAMGKKGFYTPAYGKLPDALSAPTDGEKPMKNLPKERPKVNKDWFLPKDSIVYEWQDDYGGESKELKD